MHTRTGPHAFFIISAYSSGRSRPSFSTARLMTCQCVSTSRTFSTSSIQRDVIHAKGHSGSNQKSTRVFSAMAIGFPSQKVSPAQPRRGAVMFPVGRRVAPWLPRT